MRILVVGFGAFLDVADNPAGKVARAVDGLADVGRGAEGLAVVGREIPVSYARAPALTRSLAIECAADFVLGVGVARGRSQPEVERVGRRHADPSLADVDGVRLRELAPAGPERIECADAETVAAALRVGLSDDAGAYVCNAWLYRMLASALAGGPPAGSPAGRMRVAFLHVPPAGIAVDRLAEGLRALNAGR